jgi:hypothetical protein
VELTFKDIVCLVVFVHLATGEPMEYETISTAMAASSEVTLWEILAFLGAGFALAALPYVIVGAICAGVAFTLAVLVGVLAFVAVQAWIVVAPAVVPVSWIAFQTICLITRLAIVVGLAWGAIKLAVWALV